MADEWVGVINTTAPKYLKGAVDSTIRKRLLLSMLEKRGRFSFNNSSFNLTWDVMFDQPPVEAYADGGLINFARNDLYRQCTIDWRGYVATDSMTRKERMMNDGDVAIIKRYNRIIPNLIQGLRDRFSTELYIDGYASGNENRAHGLESFLSNGSNSGAATDKMVIPSDTYGGRTTAPSQYGTWSADIGSTVGNTPAGIASGWTNYGFTTPPDWPEGSGDASFDYFTPKLGNWSSTAWTGSTSWEDNCERCIRKMLQWLTLTSGADGTPTICLLAPDLYTSFKNRESAKQRIVVEHKESQDLGFSDTLNFDGCAITSEFGVPGNIGYFLNLNRMEVMSLDSELFASEGPVFDMKTDSWLYRVGFFGNCRYESPKFFGKLKNFI